MYWAENDGFFELNLGLFFSVFVANSIKRDDPVEKQCHEHRNNEGSWKKGAFFKLDKR
jgi:hypothetical protein